MSITTEHNPPPIGYLLDELGYLEEPEAAAAVGVTPKTLIDYRKAGKGPAHVELARKIFYSREAIAAWLAAGGTRGIEN